MNTKRAGPSTFVAGPTAGGPELPAQPLRQHQRLPPAGSVWATDPSEGCNDLTHSRSAKQGGGLGVSPSVSPSQSMRASKPGVRLPCPGRHHRALQPGVPQTSQPTTSPLLIVNQQPPSPLTFLPCPPSRPSSTPPGSPQCPRVATRKRPSSCPAGQLRESRPAAPAGAAFAATPSATLTTGAGTTTTSECRPTNQRPDDVRLN
jgi:hypothetical protein